MTVQAKVVVMMIDISSKGVLVELIILASLVKHELLLLQIFISKKYTVY